MHAVDRRQLTEYRPVGAKQTLDENSSRVNVVEASAGLASTIQASTGSMGSTPISGCL